MLNLGFLGLLIIALCFLLLPVVLWRRRGESVDVSRRRVMQNIYQQRLEEFGDSFTARSAGDESAVQQELVDELGRVMLAEEESFVSTGTTDGGVETQSANSVRFGVTLLVCLVPLLAVALYAWVADPGAETVRGAEVILSLPAGETTQLESWRDRLNARVADQASDDKSLYLLAHTELKLGNYAAAATAFARTHQLLPEDITVKIYWLQARYLSARGVLDGASRTLADEILVQNPNMPVVLEILALDAVRLGNAREAVRLLHKAATGSADLAQQTSFAAAIKELRTRFEEPGISVAVRAEGQVPDRASVFVIARPVGGGMPYAVVRRPAVLLPVNVRLDALVAMSEGRSIPMDEPVEIVVRLSLSGQPMAQPGDWQFQQEILVASQAEPVTAVLAPPD